MKSNPKQTAFWKHRPATTAQRDFSLPACASPCNVPPWDHCLCTDPASDWMADEEQRMTAHMLDIQQAAASASSRAV